MSETFSEAKQLCADQVRAEIDMRVGQRLIEREMLRNEYMRGITDVLYVLFLAFAAVYAAYTLIWREE